MTNSDKPQAVVSTQSFLLTSSGTLAALVLTKAGEALFAGAWPSAAFFAWSKICVHLRETDCTVKPVACLYALRQLSLLKAC